MASGPCLYPATQSLFWGQPRLRHTRLEELPQRGYWEGSVWGWGWRKERSSFINSSPISPSHPVSTLWRLSCHCPEGCVRPCFLYPRCALCTSTPSSPLLLISGKQWGPATPIALSPPSLFRDRPLSCPCCRGRKGALRFSEGSLIACLLAYLAMPSAPPRPFLEQAPSSASESLRRRVDRRKKSRSCMILAFRLSEAGSCPPWGAQSS